jgi:hypothetical protein
MTTPETGNMNPGEIPSDCTVEPVSSGEQFRQQSEAYARRTVYGIPEVLARTQGEAALHQYVLGGTTSWTSERSRTV